MSTDTTFNRFEVDESAVITFIHSQNGCIGKAIVELITNSVDANSEKCSVHLSNTSFSVKDTGTGFGSKDDVMLYFKRFGTPHEVGDAHFGRFRLGRGQIMQFGEIIWQSHQHEMITNIEESGYGFDYKELVPDEMVNGCNVTGKFYKELSNWDLHQAKRVIEDVCRYLDMVVILNGLEINAKNDDIHWDIENNEFKLKWTNDDHLGVRLYNTGALVKEIPRQTYGLSADVITKKSLKLNVSRNEIIDTDPIWIAINTALLDKSKALLKNKKNTRMNESRRRSYIEQLKAGVIGFDDVVDLPILKDARGKYLKISSLSKLSICITPNLETHTQRIAETIIMQKISNVLHANELDVWRVSSLEELMELLLVTTLNESSDSIQQYRFATVFSNLKFISFSVLRKMINTEKKLIPNKELKPREAAAKNAMQYVSGMMSKRISNVSGHRVDKRKVLIGECSNAEGWTDAESFIAINRNMLKLLDTGRPGTLQLAALMLHEYCHDANNPDSSDHSEEFYERYHNLSAVHGRNEILGSIANSLYKQYAKQLVEKEIMLPKVYSNEFHWPIINDLVTIECELANKGLSAFAKVVLKVSGVTTKISRSKLIVSYPTMKMKDIRNRINTFIKTNVIPEAKLQPLDDLENALKGTIGFKERYEKINEHVEKAAHIWANNHEYDLSAVELFLLQGSVRYRFSNNELFFLIKIICTDSQSGILAYSSTKFENNITFGSPYFEYNNISPLQYNGYTIDGYNANLIEKMKVNSGDRSKFAVARIKEIVLSIKNNQEQKQLLDSVFSVDFAEQFR